MYTSVSPTIMSRLYCGNWKIKASGDFFSVAGTKNMHFFENSATLLKSSNIVSESVYWKRRTKMSPN